MIYFGTYLFIILLNDISLAQQDSPSTMPERFTDISYLRFPFTNRLFPCASIWFAHILSTLQELKVILGYRLTFDLSAVLQLINNRFKPLDDLIIIVGRLIVVLVHTTICLLMTAVHLGEIPLS